MMNLAEIKQILPHREPMLLVEAAEVQDGVAYGQYRVKGEEFFLQGHFPGRPIVPGVILCEMLAQTAGILLNGEVKGQPLFTGLEQVRFKALVKPGDLVETQCQIVRSKPPFYFAKGVGKVAGKICVQADFSFAIIEEAGE